MRRTLVTLIFVLLLAMAALVVLGLWRSERVPGGPARAAGVLPLGSAAPDFALPRGALRL